MDTKRKLNCWEVKNCGRQPGGEKADAYGVCPAYPDNGRRCARVAGTFCGGQMQGIFAVKLRDCLMCEFYGSEHYDSDYRS